MKTSFCLTLFLGAPLTMILWGTGLHAQKEVPLQSPGAILQESAEKAVEVRQASQKLADQWSAQADDLRSEIDTLESELETLQWRRKKIAAYMRDLEDKMAGLRSKQQAAMEIRNELEPFLDEALQKLKTFSENDLPMLAELQAPRLRSTEITLNNADADIVQKTRSILEATTQALEYGYFPEVDESEIDVDGRQIRAQRLCVGRLCLFALSGDGRDAWKWQRESRRYESVHHFARSIQEIVQIAQRTRLVSLVKLPVGPAQKSLEENSP